MVRVCRYARADRESGTCLSMKIARLRQYPDIARMAAIGSGGMR
jgi:hypothetical protein